MRTSRALLAISSLALSLVACDPINLGIDATLTDSVPRGEKIVIDDVWSGSFLNFDLVTYGSLQAVAYYNSAKQLVVAGRNIGSNTWTKKVLLSDASVWDSHRSVTLAFDDLGYLHVSGNMHNSPLIYFRSSNPIINSSDVIRTDFLKVNKLGGSTYGAFSPELKVTYPGFFRGPGGEFIFSYRERNLESTSGGIWVLLKYDHAARAYTRYTPASLFQWDKLYSVYPKFVLKNGVMHVLFMWRDSGGVESNFGLGYIRSSDLVNWKDGLGRAVTLPVTPNSLNTIIDPVPIGGGLYNGGPDLDIMRDGSPLVVYHKYETGTGDPANPLDDVSQVYAARPSPLLAGKWMIRKLTKNQAGYRWNLPESGAPLVSPRVNAKMIQQSLDSGISVVDVNFGGTQNPDSGSYAIDQGLLTPLMSPLMTNYLAPNNVWLLSSSFVSCKSNVITDSLAPMNTTYEAPPNQAKMVTHRVSSSGGLSALQYYLSWETIPSYNDLPRFSGAQSDGTPVEITPPPAELSLYRTLCDLSVPATNSGGRPTGKVLKPQTATLSGGMTQSADVRLAFGNYLSSSDNSSTSTATWTFDVSYAGYYGLAGNVFGPNASSDSFFVKVDNNPAIAWYFQQAGGWVYQVVSSGAARGQQNFYLTPGTHTISLVAREAGAQLQYLWIYLANRGMAYSGPAVSTSGFDLVSSVDAGAISGSSVSSSISNVSIAAARATYSISVYKAGKYLIFGRTKSQGLGHEKFGVAVNGASLKSWSLPNAMKAWSWGIAPVGSNGDGIVTLPAGVSTISVSGVETGASIDSFYAHFLGE